MTNNNYNNRLEEVFDKNNNNNNNTLTVSHNLKKYATAPWQNDKEEVP